MWPIKKRPPHVKLGGKKIEVHPLNLPNMVELMLIMAPYWPIVARHRHDLETALVENDADLLTEIFTLLRPALAQAPGDITKIVSLLIGGDMTPETLATTATGAEIFKAVTVLDKVHDFRKLWQILYSGRAHFPLGHD